MTWQTKKQLVKLLVDLVEHASITGSQGEIALAEYLYSLLKEKKYFQQHPEYLQLHPVPDGRSFLTAFVKQVESEETVVLLSHFDVVEVQDYGDLTDLAFRPVELTQELKKRNAQMPKAASEDLESDEWLFGRGTMDMKAGISVQLAMLERAMSGEFNGNILFISVPDEEVNSAGMQSAVPVLDELKKRYGLTYKACVNSEPMFAKYPNDQNHYIYTGSIGKVLASFYCNGIETHVGEPFSGLNANLILSEINRLMELNDSFCEQVGDEVTPPPTSLMMRDLKQEYSVQIPHASVSMYNLLMMNRPFSELHKKLVNVAKEAAVNVERFYQDRVQRYNKFIPFTPLDRKINVFTYKELLQKAINKYGDQEVERRINSLLTHRGVEDDRDFSTKLVGELVGLCKEYSPMIVLFYSPPYYPAVSSKENELIQKTVDRVVTHAKKVYQIDLKQQHYFPGLCDLSFVQLHDDRQSIARLTTNMPLYGNHFSLPLKEMQSLNIPVLNIGPVGRDPHKWTERLHIPYAFETYPELLCFSIKSIFNEDE
ncbi:M20/M25/M40 family metallo-hydrolase [Metabacillus rhizolycopersici]|uniref:M20/M25/M40 family metallo-hydrolase n=1 Tax=Metabacillus rhizolycopersici TaxID=2875709 RepID=A0ABS7UR96_9BACI|nr:M20/M25/M40 family metallo-hydrolase [Metabacillus rhizolycopersici]MBZ5750444.1 M20/M25/M40 family metallo-hydrolase [Metabacillus rhizolycopersici]